MQISLDMPITNFELSVRTSNCLSNANIRTLKALLEHTEARLMKLPHFGRKSLNEIKDVLKDYGLYLGGSIEIKLDYGTDTIDAEIQLHNLVEQKQKLDLEIYALTNRIDELKSRRSKYNTIYAFFPERHQQVLKARIEGAKIKEISLMMNVTPERIRQILARCYRHLRDPRAKHLREEMHNIGVCKEVFGDRCDYCIKNSEGEVQ